MMNDSHIEVSFRGARLNRQQAGIQAQSLVRLVLTLQGDGLWNNASGEGCCRRMDDLSSGGKGTQNSCRSFSASIPLASDII